MWGTYKALRRCGAALVGFDWKLDLTKRKLRLYSFADDSEQHGDVNVLLGVSLSGASDQSWGEIER